MRTTRLTKVVSFVGIASLVAACTSGEKKATDTTATANAKAAAAPACPAGSDAQLKLPAGFCATIFADSLGPARHMAVAPNGVLYVVFERTKPSPEKQLGGQPEPKAPSGVAALKDNNGDGKADTVALFGAMGNTGAQIYNGKLYVDEGKRIVRYTLDSSSLAPKGNPETVISGIPGWVVKSVATVVRPLAPAASTALQRSVVRLF